MTDLLMTTNLLDIYFIVDSWQTKKNWKGGGVHLAKNSQKCPVVVLYIWSLLGWGGVREAILRTICLRFYVQEHSLMYSTSNFDI